MHQCEALRLTLFFAILEQEPSNGALNLDGRKMLSCHGTRPWLLDDATLGSSLFLLEVRNTATSVTSMNSWRSADHRVVVSATLVVGATSLSTSDVNRFLLHT